MFKNYFSKVFFIYLFLIQGFVVNGQKQQHTHVADIQLALHKINVLGSVLYIAAHPDDENTRLISYLANDKLVNTAYLSLTRGDGGQNLIGTELGPALGLIRTQELLEARKIDGGKQYFSRAKDFGFSKHPDETFTIWDREGVLADVVWVIRNFRPDVIITRFNTEPGTTHGHHTASAILAEEAFAAAADKNRFPEQLKYVNTWQPRRLYWNTSSWFFQENKFDTTGLVKADVGKYNPVLGRSYTEISAESRSMHKSQGFGAAATRGSAIEYLQPLRGNPAPEEILEGIDISWSRVKGGEKVGSLLKKAAQSFNAANPSAIIPQLLEANKALKAMPPHPYKQIKLEELQAIIEACLGLYAEAVANDYSAAPGDSIKISMEIVNRSPVNVTFDKISYSYAKADSAVNVPLKENSLLTFSKKIKLPENMEYSQPYWLREEGTLGMYAVDDLQLVGKPENKPSVEVTFDISLGNQRFNVVRPLMYKRTDPVEGEQYRNLEIIPPVFVNVKEGVLIFESGDAKKLDLVVRAGKSRVNGLAKLQLPIGWKSIPESLPVSLNLKGEETTLTFEIIPPLEQSTGEIKAAVLLDGKAYSKGYQSLAYNHIPNQLMMPEAKARVSRLALKKRGEQIGYIMGAGDEIPTSLRQIGYNVTILGQQSLTLSNLQNFDAVIVGIRAFNTVEHLKFTKNALFEYAKQGGTVIVQYNTSGGLLTKDIAPLPMTVSRDRVTVEEAPVKFLNPNHKVLNWPNTITEHDFEDWVQERGLYFASEWDPKFEAVLSMHDPGESSKDGSLIIASYGKGYYIYTGLSFFRQLPAGVPGAYRLFSNLISIGEDDSSQVVK